MRERMKAARLHRIGEKLSVDLVEMPKVGPDDIIVEVQAAGICHSDINYRDGVGSVGKLPITLGHEIAGLVTKGKRAEGIEEGDRVCVHYVISCGTCEFCRTDRENYCYRYQMIGKDTDGGFAQYVKVPVRNVLKLPKAIPFEQGAILGCAVSTAFHALKRARPHPGDTVVIYGVGGLGVHAIQLATKIFDAGKAVAVDVLDEKLKLAKSMGADEFVNSATDDLAERIKDMTDGKLAEVVLDFVGRKRTIEKAIECVGKGGRVAVVGIGGEDLHVSPYKTIINKEMELIGVNDHLKSELTELITLVESGRIDLSGSITHRLPLEEVNRGIQILEEKIGNPIRVVVRK